MGLKEDMLAMGFGENRTDRALQAVRYESLERAIAWLECHENDPDIDEPVCVSGGNVLGSATTPEQMTTSVEEAAPTLTPEERAQKLADVQAKLAERRKAVEEKDKQDAILKEKIRRKEGQSISEMREKRQADEMRKIAEERKKQKADDERSRKAILQKIKDDRAKAKAEKDNGKIEEVAAPVATVQTTPAVAKNYDECKLQIRLPTGQPIVNTFKAEETLGDVVAFIRDTTQLQEFSLMTSFPRKTFQTSDFGFSLKSVGLCPSSVLIVSKAK